MILFDRSFMLQHFESDTQKYRQLAVSNENNLPAYCLLSYCDSSGGGSVLCVTSLGVRFFSLSCLSFLVESSEESVAVETDLCIACCSLCRPYI